MGAVTAALAREYPETNSNHGASVTPLHEDVVGSTRPALLVLLAAVACVLLIACANVSNLLLARATARHKELAVRSALGASRGRLMRQLLTESVLLALAGGTAGLLLAMWGRDVLLWIAPSGIPRADEVAVDGAVLGFTLLVTLATGFAFGAAPAFQASKLDLSGTLKEGGKGVGGAGRKGVRNALVVAEVALSLMLLVAAGLMTRSFVGLLGVDPGLEPNGVLTAQMSLPDSKYREPEQVGAAVEDVLGRLQASPDVEAAAVVTPLPLTGEGYQTDFLLEGRPLPERGEYPNTDIHSISPDYFKAMGVPLLRGRAFTPADRKGAPQVAVVNETMARRFWPGEDPVGRKLALGGPAELANAASNAEAWWTIVGVVGDVRQYGLDAEPKTQVYMPHQQAAIGYVTLVVRARSDAAALAPTVRQAVHAVDREQPIYNVRTMEDVLATSMASRRLAMFLLGAFAALALALAAVGIYGVMSYSVAQRTHEIGVRMALGARRGDVLRLVVGQGMATALVGLALGVAGSLAAMRLMSSLLFGVSANDPATFGGVAALLAAVALVASWVPARRASRVDPMIALRTE
jgi:putative ABC transport system permease protein